MFYNKPATPVKCLNLVVFPPDSMIESTLKKLYTFSTECPYTLKVSKKSGIACNSNQNADKKALSAFPSSYIRMDVSKSNKAIYSYYKDLTQTPSKEDITTAFHRLQKDLL
jgi:hypothetical protein